MIVRDHFEKDSERYVKTYSDISVYIKNKADQLFVEAIDPIQYENERTYVETNISIEIPDIPIIPETTIKRAFES